MNPRNPVMDDSRLVVALMTYQRGRTAAKTLTTLASDPHVERILILDDGSDEKEWVHVQKVVDGHGHVIPLRNASNMGFSRNYERAMRELLNSESEFLMLCETDMQFAKGWGKAILDAFDASPSTVAVSPMLQWEQLERQKAERFKKRCLIGNYYLPYDPSLDDLKKPFGSCFETFPDTIPGTRIHHHRIRYVADSICTLAFRKGFLAKLPLDDMTEHKMEEDNWICWACFQYNDLNPKSIAVLDPGVAFTFGEPGLHGGEGHVLRNHRWSGSFWWRYGWTARISRWTLQHRLTFFKRMRGLFIRFGGVTPRPISKKDLP